MGMVTGNKYLIKCGWGDTVAKLEYIVQAVPNLTGKAVYHFKEVGTNFKFVTNDLVDVSEVSND